MPQLHKIATQEWQLTTPKYGKLGGKPVSVITIHRQSDPLRRLWELDHCRTAYKDQQGQWICSSVYLPLRKKKRGMACSQQYIEGNEMDRQIDDFQATITLPQPIAVGYSIG